MSYPPPYGTPGTPTPPGTYPYGYAPHAYAHPQTPGAYPYGAYPAPAYGWHYSYYLQQPHAQASQTTQRTAQSGTPHAQTQVAAQQTYVPPQQAYAQSHTATATTNTGTTAQPAQHAAQRAQFQVQPQYQQYQAPLQQVQTVAALSQQRPATQSPAPSVPYSQRPTFSAYNPNRDSTAGGATGRAGRRGANFRGMFTKDLKNLMYGFGDDRNPSNDSVNVMEEVLIEYIMDVCQTASSMSKKTRLSIDDLRKALSRPADAKKLARMEELLFAQEDIKRARAQFEEDELQRPKQF